MNVLSSSVSNLFISSTSRTFLSYIHGDLANVFEFNQLNWPWERLVCSVSIDTFQSSCCLVDTLYCVLRLLHYLYSLAGKPQGYCLVIALVCCYIKYFSPKFSPGVKAASWINFFNSCLNFWSIFGIHGSFLIFLKLFYFYFLFFDIHHVSFERMIYCDRFRQTSIRICSSWLTYFSEHIVCARCRKSLKIPLIVLAEIQEAGFTWMVVVWWHLYDILESHISHWWCSWYWYQESSMICHFDLRICILDFRVLFIENALWYWKRAWLSLIYRLKVFGIIWNTIASEIVFCSKSLKKYQWNLYFLIIKFYFHRDNNIYL